MTDEDQRRQIVQTIERTRVSAIIRTDDQQLAADAMNAVVDGGFTMVEFTLTTPGAFDLIASFARRDGLLVGAGTVLTPGQARSAVDAGARFLVSPVCDHALIEASTVLGVPRIPGTYTPTEMQQAYEWGAEFVKLFPAPAGGVDYVRAVRGPLPHLRIFPTAGPTPENFADYLDAGCAGVGFVRSLFMPTDLAERKFNAIRSRASRILAKLAAWRESNA